MPDELQSQSTETAQQDMTPPSPPPAPRENRLRMVAKNSLSDESSKVEK